MHRFYKKLFEQFLRNISGFAGRRLRYLYYRRRLGSCGKNVAIDEGVFLINPGSIFLGDHIWIDKSVIMIAGIAGNPATTKYIPNSSFTKNSGEIHIGNYSHIGIGTIIQGHGGVEIGNYFTSSPGCKIYSLSNDVAKSRQGTFSKETNFYVATPVKIGSNVWLGLNVSVIGNTIGSDTFVAAHSVVSRNIIPNSFASGNPASRIKERFS
jgi:galactoside O-acetyltransferase